MHEFRECIDGRLHGRYMTIDGTRCYDIRWDRVLNISRAGLVREDFLFSCSVKAFRAGLDEDFCSVQGT